MTDNTNVQWGNDYVRLRTPTVGQCEGVMAKLAKEQPTGKKWSIQLSSSFPTSTEVVVNNLNKCAVNELNIILATPLCISVLSKILPTNNILKTLDLSLHPNTSNVIKEMSSSLSTNTSLEVLLFSSLDVTEEDSVCLSEVLAVNKTECLEFLTVTSLTRISSISVKVSPKIVRLIPWKSMKIPKLHQKVLIQ